MNAIVKEFPGEEGTFFRTDVKEPSPGYGQVKVKVMAASICGSDIHALYSGLMQDRYAFPVIIGHEGAGVVVEVGEGVHSIRVGDRVTAETTLTACHTCEYCRRAQTNMCADRKGLGSAADGYFAQYCIVAENACHKLADNLSYEVGSLAEPFACAVHATCILTDIKPGDVVLVVGPGPIGDLVAITAKLCGAVIVMSGLTADAERMAFARRQFGVDHTVDCQTEDLEAFLKSITDGRGADFVFECTGSRAGIQSGLKMCKRKGTYVAVGMNMGEIPVDYYLVLNLLRDQVVRNGNPDLVFEKIAEAIAKHPDMTLILNANEPISQNLAGNYRTVYFAMDRTERSTDHCVSGTNDCKICPHCFHPMNYAFYHYNHLGKFHCSHCDYGSHQPDFFGTDADFAGKCITINDTPVHVTYNTTFNFFNTIAAAAVCCTASGMSMEQFAAGCADFYVAKERLDDFKFDGRRTVLMMTKQNAASLDQSISYVLEQPGEKSIALYINNVIYLEYKDVSWLYDVAFERLHGKVEKILCTGNRALDAAVCLKTAGFDDDTLLAETDMAKTKEAFRKTKGDIYILAASAFGNEGKILEELKK